MGLPRLAQAFLGHTGPAREEIQRAEQPAPPCARLGGHQPDGQDLRLGHLTAGDQDLQRIQQAAIRRPGLAARRRRLRQPGCRLRHPAQAVGLPAGRLELGRQPVVPAGRHRHPVPQRFVPIHQARRLLVHPAPPRRAEIVVHGPLQQQVGEPDHGHGPARSLDQDLRLQRLAQGRQRITKAGQGGRGRELAVLAEHRGRRDELLSRRAQCARARQHHPGQRPRHLQRPATQVSTPEPLPAPRGSTTGYRRSPPAGG